MLYSEMDAALVTLLWGLTVWTHSIVVYHTLQHGVIHHSADICS